MNILFLIGNGFDLNLGLETKYPHVLKAYLEENENNTDKKLSKFLSVLQSKEDDALGRELKSELWSDFEKGIGKLSDEYNSDEIDDYIDSIRHFTDFMVNRLKEEELRVEFPAKGQKLDKFNNLIGKRIFGFFRYLPESTQKLLENRLSQDTKNNYRIISFNYTSIFDKCVTSAKKYLSDQKIKNFDIEECRHIHGRLDENLTMGVDNENQITNTDFARKRSKSQFLIKPIVAESVGNFSRKNDAYLIMESDVICIFGMSFGETDKTWWKMIGKWFQDRYGENGEEKEKHLIYFAKSQGKEKYKDSVHPAENIEVRKEYKDKFYKVADILISNDDMNNSFHVVIDVDIFDLKSVLVVKQKEKQL